MIVGKWFEYGEIKRMNDGLDKFPWNMKSAGDICNRCIRACQKKHSNSTVSWSWEPKRKHENDTGIAYKTKSSASQARPLKYPPPPAVDLCIFQECGRKALCPPILHDMNITWSEYKPAKGWPAAA
jgi:hypothetical protein